MSGPEFASRLAAVLSEIGDLFRDLGRGKGLKVIVASCEETGAGAASAIEFRIGAAVRIPDGQVVSLLDEKAKALEGDSGSAEDEIPVFQVLPISGVELVRPVDLSDPEAEILDLFTRERKKLQAKELAPKLGRSNDSRLRLLLSRMRKTRKLLDNDPTRGYYPTILGLESLRCWRGRQQDLFGEPA